MFPYGYIPGFLGKHAVFVANLPKPTNPSRWLGDARFGSLVLVGHGPGLRHHGSAEMVVGEKSTEFDGRRFR